ncbi:hypothetical protein [Myxococcus xanthus]|uniref:hypothetical protein n=1 Tax=Myxococcus xanthus TaxID=34 RepID=UPI00112B5049|nr:hypothetical protein [Myxococcus xanthus]QDE83343.1 hypothetical protein BHS07_18245 [Myxococcus xanthus]
MECNAKWEGGACDRDAWAKGLCSGHYQQQRRGQDYAPLRKAGDNTLEMIGVRITREDKQVLESEAQRRGVDDSEVYREAISRYAARLRKELDGR